MFHAVAVVAVVEMSRMSLVVGRWCRHRGICRGRDRTGSPTSAGRRPRMDRTDAGVEVGVVETGREDAPVVKMEVAS